MHIHVMRVQDTPSQRCWWMKGDNAETDLTKFSPRDSLARAIQTFEERHSCSIEKITRYRGIHRPSEAVMTVLDIIRKHEK